MLKINVDGKVQSEGDVIKEQKGKGLYLIEVQDHFDGKFLLFDSKPQSVVVPDTIASLSARVKELEDKLGIGLRAA
jgi:hypothetical protein